MNSIIKTEKAMAPHSSTLAWKIPWMEETGGHFIAAHFGLKDGSQDPFSKKDWLSSL